MIGNLGFFELTLFGIIALIVLGPDKLPVAARTLGRWYGMFHRASQKLQTEITNELQLLETQQMLKKELDEIRQSEARIKAQMNALERSLDRTKTQQQNTQKNQPAKELPNHDDFGIQVECDDDKNLQETHAIRAALTLPMINHWFLMSSYDHRRRLPPAPYLPNHIADPLLNQPNRRP